MQPQNTKRHPSAVGNTASVPWPSFGQSLGTEPELAKSGVDLQHLELAQRDPALGELPGLCPRPTGASALGGIPRSLLPTCAVSCEALPSSTPGALQRAAAEGGSGPAQERPCGLLFQGCDCRPCPAAQLASEGRCASSVRIFLLVPAALTLSVVPCRYWVLSAQSREFHLACS